MTSNLSISTLQEIVKVNQALEKLWVAQCLSTSHSKFPDILTALSEAVTNAITHGNQNDETKTVTTTLVYQKKAYDTLTITVCDQGSGFDPDNLPDPTSPELIGTPGGRGVMLMKALSDKIAFSTSGAGGMCVTMDFDIGTSETTDTSDTI